MNRKFEMDLSQFIPKRGMAELFKEIVCDVTADDVQQFDEQKTYLVSEISAQNNVITKIRAMLLSDDITPADFKIMKVQCEEKIVKLEAELKDLKQSEAVKTDFNNFVDEA